MSCTRPGTSSDSWSNLIATGMQSHFHGHVLYFLSFGMDFNILFSFLLDFGSGLQRQSQLLLENSGRS